MKLSPHLFAILAVGALSTDAAVAKHHHGARHHHGSPAGASYSRTDAKGVTKSPTGTGGQQGSVRGTEAGVPAHVDADGADKGTFDKLDPHSKAPSNLTVVPGSGTPEAGPGAPIDTSITVHQGAKELKELKDHLRGRLFKKSNTAIALPTKPALHHAHGVHQKLPFEAGRSPKRNAIGAVLAHGTTTPTTSAPPPVTNPVAVGADHVTSSAGGSTPTDKANTLGAEGVRHHGPAAGAIGVVSANGLSVNGTGIGHPWLGTGALGGPSKTAGVLNGTGFRAKNP